MKASAIALTALAEYTGDFSYPFEFCTLQVVQIN